MIPKIYNGGEPFLTGIDYSKYDKGNNVITQSTNHNYHDKYKISSNPVILSKKYKDAINILAVCLVIGVSFSLGFIIGKNWS